MTIRNIARRFGRDVQCNRSVANALVMPGWKMPRAVQALRKDEQRVLMQWLTRHGPFWEDDRRHPGSEWLECNGELVTDTAVGEAAYCLLREIDRSLVSIKPSLWLRSPLSVDLRNGQTRRVDVLNYSDSDAVRSALAVAPVPMQSWNDLAAAARRRFPGLTFGKDSFDPLHGSPFSKGLRIDCCCVWQSYTNSRTALVNAASGHPKVTRYTRPISRETKVGFQTLRTRRRRVSSQT